MEESPAANHPQNRPDVILADPKIVEDAESGTESLKSVDPLKMNLPCRSCGYNLRGLLPSGECPECGGAVEDSLQAELLRFNDLAQLRKIHWGFRLAYGSVTLGLISVITLAVFSFLMIFVLPSVINPISEKVGGFLALLLGLPFLAVPILYPLSCWWISTPDPLDADRIRRYRICLRWTAIFLPFGLASVSALRTSVMMMGISLPVMVEIGSHVVFLIFWLHIFSLAEIAGATFERCESATSAKQHKSHARAVAKGQRWAKKFPAILLVLRWLGVGFLFFILGSTGGRITPAGLPLRLGGGIGFFWIGVLWLSTVGMLGYVTKPVRGELMVARGLSFEEFERLNHVSNRWWKRLLSLERTI